MESGITGGGADFFALPVLLTWFTSLTF